MNQKRILRPTLLAAVAFAKAKGEDEGLTFVLPEDLTELSEAELAELTAKADEAIEALADEPASDEVNEALEGLVAAKELLAAEAGARTEAQAAKEARKAELLAKANPVEEAAEEAVAEATEDGDEATEADVAEVVAEAEAIVEETATPALVASAPRPKRIVLPGAAAARTAPKASTTVTERSPFAAAANLPGYAPGAPMDKGEIAEALNASFRGVSKASIQAAQRAGQRFSQRYGIANIDKRFSPEARVGDDYTQSQIEAAHKFVTDQSRLPGGSLVAAGGWCAPSETVYDLCKLESRDGLISIPEINIPRGGLRFTQGPDWSTILATTGFCFTEADDIDGNYDGAESGPSPKPVDTVPCPDFTDVRLDVCGVIVNGGILQNRAYPEVTDRYVDMVLTGHFHRVATNVIASMVAQSTAVSPTSMGGLNGSSTANILSAVELQATDIRYKYRMMDSTVLEAVFPIWSKGLIRADLSRRTGVDMLDVSDEMIMAWFRRRKINAQFVYNWQNLGGSPATVWPTTMDFLIYPAGTFVKGTSDIITIEMLHDSTLNAENNFTAIFTEEGYSVMKMCHEARNVTVATLCAGGWTNQNVGVTTCA
jgi:hypothetical protein